VPLLCLLTFWFFAVQTVKKEIQVSEEKDRKLLAKASLDIPLLAENHDDIQLATTVRFHSQLGMLMHSHPDRHACATISSRQ
jgi:hypothetical protein